MVKKANTAKSTKTKAKAEANPKDAKLLDSLRSYIRAKGSQLMADPRVTSVGIGYTQAKDAATPELAIQFTVDVEAMPQGATLETAPAIPSSIEVNGVQVPTEVIPRTYKPTYTTVTVQNKDLRKVRADVLAPGMSVGNRFTSAGTIGAFVRDRTSGKVVLLSNWHVLQGSKAVIGADVVQPGRHDDNRVELNRMGTLLRSHLGAAGDCAIASVSGRSVSSGVLELGVPVAAIGDPQIGDAVVKSGRTTGVTHGKVVRVEVNTRLNYGDGVVATIGGFEIGVDPAKPAPDGEISRGGDSGSAWLAVNKNGKPTDVMLGLHFAGDADGTASEFALACCAESVMTALEVEPVGVVAIEAASLADGLVERSGFDRGFLTFSINAPKFIKSRKDDLATLDGNTEISYCHFSAWLSKKRKYPLCVAWNIDGGKFKHLKRTNFRVDRRGDLADHQLTNALYEFNPLDKGHVARRADLCWGETVEEARQGNYDSFYYTNIAPQHEAFNQSDNIADDPEGGVWGRLENTILDSENPHKLRISLMGGPVFGPKDRKFVQNDEETLLPDEYWKLIAFRDDTDDQEKVFAFLLTQKHLVEPLAVVEGLDLEPWLWARITLQDLEGKTGIRFGDALRQREVPFVAPQISGDGPSLKIVTRPDEYFASR